MHTVVVIGMGLALLGAILIIARVAHGSAAVMSKMALVFLPMWLIGAGVNLWFDVGVGWFERRVGADRGLQFPGGGAAHFVRGTRQAAAASVCTFGACGCEDLLGFFTGGYRYLGAATRGVYGCAGKSAVGLAAGRAVRPSLYGDCC